MQTLPIATQAVASKSTSTRTGNSGSDTRDFLPTLNKAEAKNATRTEPGGSRRSAPETASRQEIKSQRRGQDQETRQAEQDQDVDTPVSQDAASEVDVPQETAQAANEQETGSEERADKDVVDGTLNAIVATSDPEALPAEEIVAAEGDQEEGVVAGTDVAAETLGDELADELVGPRVHEERQQQTAGLNRAAEAKAAQTAQGVSDPGVADGEPLDEAQLAQKIKEQLVQPASIKAESVQVAAQTMDQLKNSNQVQIEVVDGVAGLNPEGEEDSGKITDPRFASLLNRQDVETVLRQRQTPAQVAANSSGLSANGAEKVAETMLNATTGNKEATVDMAPAKANAAVDALLQRAAGDTTPQADSHQAVVHTAHQQTPSATSSTFAPGQRPAVNVPDSHIVNQTVEHLSIHARGESSSVTVRLHPEELGELQLRMVMEGDQLKVHLHAQSQQVQDVLERNFPRLRDALQDQGMTVEDFQVSVDSGDAQQQQSFSQQGHNRGQGSVAVTMDADMMAQVAEVVPGAAIDSSSGISVRI